MQSRILEKIRRLALSVDTSNTDKFDGRFTIRNASLVRSTLPLYRELKDSRIVLFRLKQLNVTLAASVIYSAVAMASFVATNVSVDDNSPDPLTGAQFVYGPNNPNVTWNIGQDCTNCIARPDPSQMFDGTWHDGSFFLGKPILSTSISFIVRQKLTVEDSSVGTAVYVMAAYISTAPITHIASQSTVLLTFQINGTTVGIFNRTSAIGLEVNFEYDFPVFSKDNLPLGRHELTILNGGGPTSTLFLFDRIIYTPSIIVSDVLQQTSLAGSPPTSTESCLMRGGSMIQAVPESSSNSNFTSTLCEAPSSSSRKIGVIVGAVVSSVISLIFLGTVLLVRRRKRASAASESDVSFGVAAARPDFEDDESPPDYTSLVLDLSQSPAAETPRDRSASSGENHLSNKAGDCAFSVSNPL
ncbi:hypothetical protein SCHPADRAFT_890293 [Schizopora paradoxa]|uniref:Uncharacterized protein n=1 Tax=Schizopora paradoxa TaxID=27342 RepID=A0A0H2RUI2_9AGAM|nr:hypothetical protein SCHPADRAFT_890293 [Schizopora paradoxa]